MLKTAAKQKKLLMNNYQSRPITTHYVYLNNTLKNQARKDMLDTHAFVKYHVGFLRLNREHRHNMLTLNYLKNIRRSLETLNVDDVVKVIYMTGGKGEHFSNGTDFRTLLHYKKEGQMEKVASYLEELYGLQIQASKLNKPVIGVAPGHSFNSGAAFLQATGMPTVTLDSKLSFNESRFGFVPHAGSSYYLSRLPGEIGTFLALTGFPITGIDAKEFGIADELVHFSGAFEEEVAETLYAMEFPIPNYDLLTNKRRYNPWREQIQQRNESDEGKLIADEFERARKKHENLIAEEFYEPKDKVPSMSANADYQYKKMLETYNKRFENEEWYLEGSGKIDALYQNYFRYVLGYVKGHAGHEYPQDPKTLLLKNAQAINRCFFPSTLEEIRENLKAEDSPFSKLCLQQMDQNSEISMKLALKMLRNARNLDYKGAMKQELNVALNKISDKEFDSGVSEILLKPQNGRGSPSFSKNVSEDKVQSYFAPNKWSEKIELDIVEKAMLPTRFYYERFSDQVRLWINEDSTPQPEVRAYFEEELKEALKEQGIDIRDRSLTIEAARGQLYKAELSQRRQQAYEDRLNHLLKDDKLRESYFKQTQDHLDRLEHGEKFYSLVNKHIQQIFEAAYLENLQNIYDRSKEAHDLEKRRMIINFKKFLYQSRVLTYQQDELDRQLLQLKNMPFKEPHLTEKWDGDKSFREMQHPDAKNSFLGYLSKAVGKASIAPQELTKAYLTNGTVAKQLTTYTFDHDELKKLRADILANPEKYELALRQQRATAVKNRLGDKQIIKQKKFEEYNYWFRVLNGGILPQDSLPYYKQLVAYKDFVDQVEGRAFNTLRLTVQRLLKDFEEPNSDLLKTYSGKDEKESKTQALRRLIGLMNGAEDSAKDIQGTAQIIGGKQQQYLTQSGRAPKDIKRFINRLIEQDSEMKQLIPSEVKGNNLVNKFREEVLQELYQLIELVLINNAGGNRRAGTALPPKHLLQERLASLTNPSNTQQRNVTNLRVIDSFLNEQNSETLIKDAIRIAKPYFFENVIGQRLDQEARKVFDAFKTETTANEVLNYYIFNLHNPEARHGQLTQRLLSFHEDRDRQAYLEGLFPDSSRRYQIKRYLSLLGQGQQDFKNEHELEKSVDAEYEGLRTLTKKAQDVDDQIDKKLAGEYEQAMKKPFNPDDQDSEVDRFPMFNTDHFDDNDLSLFFQLSEQAENLADFLEMNGQEIRQSFQTVDWLHIYANAIKEHNLDVQSLMRNTVFTDPRDHLAEAQKALGGGNQLTWDNIADYAQFLTSLFEQAKKSLQGENVIQDYEELSDYIVKQLDIVDGEELLRSQSVFEMIKHTKDTIGRVGKREQGLRDELKDFTRLQQRLLGERKARENVQKLADSAPREVASLVEQALKNHNEYVNLGELEKLLLHKDYDKLRSQGASTFIDKERIFQNLKKGGNKALQKFLSGYLNVRLDVVSLAQAKEIVAHAPTTNLFDDKLQQQFKALLQFVEDSLKYVPHVRREAMTLGEYINRHNYLGSVASNDEGYMPQILRNKIQEVLGQSLDLKGADYIDWEFGGMRTNPMTHAQEDARIQQTLAEGKGYNPEATSDAIIESQMGGRAYQDHGEAALISYINETTGEVELKEQSTFELEKVLKDAHRLTQLRPEGHSLKAFYENEILVHYSAPEFDQKAIESLIQRYTELRLKECLLNSEFREKLHQGNNGHYYIKMLKEQIAEELSLSKPTKLSDISSTKMFLDLGLKSNPEGRYNLEDLSNLESLGYEKLLDESKERTTLDKLLQDYFLQKRGQYVASNNLLDQLNSQFGEKYWKYGDDHPYKTNDKRQMNNDAFPFEGQPGIAFAHLKQGLTKDLNPMIASQDFTAMMELDIATNQALNKGLGGLSSNLRTELEDEQLHIPEYFETFDIRKPAQRYVEDKLQQLLQNVFNVRAKVEKTLSRNELVAYDKVLAGHLTKEVLLPRLRDACEQDRNTLIQMRQGADMLKEGKKNEETQFLKRPNEQSDFNQSIKNEDALYKFLAYSGMLEKKRRDDIDKTRKNNEIIYGIENFEEFYKQELQRDAKREPREINSNDYLPKKGRFVDLGKAAEGFKTTAEREADYFREFELYKENKREQQERNQLYYVLEQKFARAKENPDPLDKAQEAIVDYFSNPENTFFFEKNKIQ